MLGTGSRNPVILFNRFVFFFDNIQEMRNSSLGLDLLVRDQTRRPFNSALSSFFLLMGIGSYLISLLSLVSL